MEVFLGTILPFGFNYAPSGWMTCAGQILSIAQNNALFALLGTTYGGDGVQTFALPNLQGRVPLGMGNGGGLTPRPLGQMGGSEATTLTTANMPMHTHTATPVNVQVAGTASNPLNAPSATNSYLGASGGGPGSATVWSDALNSPVTMSGVSGAVQIGATGGNQPFAQMNPFLALNFCVALQGIFPSRS